MSRAGCTYLRRVQSIGHTWNHCSPQGGRDFPPGLLLQILGMKIVTTAVCKGSGLVGGIYAPSIFMGAQSI